MKSLQSYKKIKDSSKKREMYMKFIPNFIYRFYVKIERIFSYIPILWRDEDWDWGFILILLSHKLNRTRECIIRNDIIVDEDQKTIDKSIRIILKLFKRINEDEYSEWLSKNVEKKWGKNFRKYLFKNSQLYHLLNEEQPEDLHTKFNEKQLKDMRDDWFECRLAGERMLLRDLNRSLRIFEKYLMFWWD